MFTPSPQAPPRERCRPHDLPPRPTTIRRPAIVGATTTALTTVLTTALALLLTGPPGHATPASDNALPWRFERIGQFGGRSLAIATEGDTAFLALGPQVEVLDISSPRQPRKIGRYVAEQVVHDIALLSGHALVLTSGNVIDVVDRDSGGGPDPRLVASLALPAADAEPFDDLVVADGHAFVAGALGLGIVDVRRPTAPTWLGLVPGIERVEDVALDGALLHVATRAGEVVLLDVSRPSEPRELSRLAPLDDGVAQSIAVRDGHAYVGMWRFDDNPLGDDPFRDDPLGGGLFGGGPLSDNPLSGTVIASTAPLPTEVFVLVIDVTEPSAPREVGRLDLSHRLEKPGRMRVVGESIFMIASHYAGPISRGIGGSVMRFDLSHPEEPSLGGDFDWHLGLGSDLAVSGDWLFVAEAFGGMRVIDIRPSVPPDAEPAAVYDRAIAPRAIAASGGTALLGDHATGGLWRLDVTQPEHVTSTAHLDLGGICGSNCEVEIQGDFAYAADENKGFIVVDLRDPAAPRMAAQVVSRISPTAMAVAGKQAFVMARHPDASSGSRLSIYDITDPDATAETGFLDLPARVTDIAHAPGYVYGMSSQGLHVFDVSDAGHPTQVATLGVGTSSEHLAIRGDTAVLLDPDGAIHVIDVGQPLRPTLIARLDEVHDDTRDPGRPLGLALADGIALVLHTRWIQAVDLRDRRQPLEVAWATGASLGMPGYLSDLAVDGERVYVAGRDSGVAILAVHRPAPLGTVFLPRTVR